MCFEVVNTFRPGSESSRDRMANVLKDLLDDDQMLNLEKHLRVWRNRSLQPTEAIDDVTITEVIWELYELNFRYELQELDRLARRSHVHHDECALMACFPLAPNGSTIFTASLDMADQGFAAIEWTSRQTQVIGLYNLMTRWKDADLALGGLGLPSSNKNSASVNIPEAVFVSAEAALVAYYCKTFYKYFHRAPTIPHRLDRS